MPITRQQFELGIDRTLEELMEKIHAYLAEHRQEAFARDELTCLVLGRPSAYDSLTSPKEPVGPDEFQRLRKEDEAFGTALDKLVSMDSVAEKKIRDRYYYSYVSELHI